ncbi:fumarylacetoacetate hydrolase family protein [Leucobacter sp. W1153]|uniref:fumarylacetoacetate hydrolase family protein n=1 Tax=Leucobacter sp. W1153 TaxID=3439064 RepID=UPI004037273A
MSTFTPLSPGDVIVTGTPGGVGLFMEPPGRLNDDDGDVVEAGAVKKGHWYVF